MDQMRNIYLIAGLVAAIGASGVTTGPAAAEGCLNPYAGVLSLTHDAMVPNEGHGYDKAFVDAQLAKGNRCFTIEQSQEVEDSPAFQYNRRANPNDYLQ
jgi:hypothetical protein